MEIDMFNPDTADRALAPCVFPVDELCLDCSLAGVTFSGELQIEIDETGDWYIESVTATNVRGVTQVYKNGHPIYHGVCAAVYASVRIRDQIYDSCVEHAE